MKLASFICQEKHLLRTTKQEGNKMRKMKRVTAGIISAGLLLCPVLTYADSAVEEETAAEEEQGEEKSGWLAGLQGFLGDNGEALSGLFGESEASVPGAVGGIISSLSGDDDLPGDISGFLGGSEDSGIGDLIGGISGLLGGSENAGVGDLIGGISGLLGGSENAGVGDLIGGISELLGGSENTGVGDLIGGIGSLLGGSDLPGGIGSLLGGGKNSGLGDLLGGLLGGGDDYSVSDGFFAQTAAVRKAAADYMLEVNAPLMETGDEQIIVIGPVNESNVKDGVTGRIFCIIQQNFTADESEHVLRFLSEKEDVVLMTLEEQEDGSFVVTDAAYAEEGEDYEATLENFKAGMLEQSMEECLESIDLAPVYHLPEALAEYLDDHPEITGIEYGGEIRTAGELRTIRDEQLYSYYGIVTEDPEAEDASEPEE